MECPTILDFKEFLDDLVTKLNRYEFINPFYKKNKKPSPYKSIYLKISNEFHLFSIYEDTRIDSLGQLSQFLGDYLEGLYPEIKAPFQIVSSARGRVLEAQSLRKIHGLYILWIGKAVNPLKGQY